MREATPDVSGGGQDYRRGVIKEILFGFLLVVVFPPFIRRRTILWTEIELREKDRPAKGRLSSGGVLCDRVDGRGQGRVPAWRM